MLIMHIRKRHNTYYYQRRVPAALQHLFDKASYLVTLKTQDKLVAIKKANIIDEEWELLLDQNRPSTLYSKVLAETSSFPEHIEDLFANGDEESQRASFKELKPIDQIRWRAAQEKLTGRPRDKQYTFSLSDGLATLRKVKTTLPPKTWAKYMKAVEYFGDQPMSGIKKPKVATWIDDCELSSSSKRTMLSCLGQIYDHAQTRGHIGESSNPFRVHQMGPDDTQSYEFMDDELLIKIMYQLAPADRLIALVGRYTGMRISEIFNSPIKDIEGITSFDVVRSKTRAGIRVVPIKSCIKDAVIQNWHTWGGPDQYSKRFGRAKKKVLGKHNRRSMSFHSLRVSFITYVGRAEWTEQQCAWLVGHEEGKGSTMSGQLYFKGYTLAKMQDIVESVPEVKTPKDLL